MRVFIYRNLNRKGVLYSLKAVDGPHKGCVVGYARGVLLANAEFQVSEAGRQRVLREGRKNVHAGVVGTVLEARGYEARLVQYVDLLATYTLTNWWIAHRLGRTIKYNPYKHPFFYYADTETRAIPQNGTFISIEEDGVSLIDDVVFASPAYVQAQWEYQPFARVPHAWTV